MALPWETIETVETPDGTLALRRRGQRDFLLTLQGRVVMTSAAHRSEDTLARLACEGLGQTEPARILVSGLGMGFTLRAALEVTGPRASLVVVELNEVVARWCAGPLGVLTNHAISDPRVTTKIGDVSRVVAELGREGRERFDAIVLDLYEGPQEQVGPGHPLYGSAALLRAKSVLRPGGVIAVWTEQPSRGFERALDYAGFEFSRKRCGTGGRVHLVYVARPRPTTQALPETRTSRAATAATSAGSTLRGTSSSYRNRSRTR